MSIPPDRGLGSADVGVVVVVDANCARLTELLREQMSSVVRRSVSPREDDSTPKSGGRRSASWSSDRLRAAKKRGSLSCCGTAFSVDTRSANEQKERTRRFGSGGGGGCCCCGGDALPEDIEKERRVLPPCDETLRWPRLRADGDGRSTTTDSGSRWLFARTSVDAVKTGGM